MGEHALLAAVGVGRRYPRRGAQVSRRGETIPALRGVTLRVEAGESVGVVGPSGSGKSTLARVLAGIEAPDEGSIAVHGVVLSPSPARRLALLRRTVQLVFQDPATSLNPRQRVGAAVREPLTVRGVGRREAARRGLELLEQVGLGGGDAFARRLPRDLSGGERQRVVLARALACDPKVLVLDEPTAALDASVRGQVVNLLHALQRRRGVALVVVTHDFALVEALCERVVVLVDGTIVEEGEAGAVLAQPRQAATAALVAASALARAGHNPMDGGNVRV